MCVSATIAGAGSALPPPMSQAGLWEGFFRAHYADARVARQVWKSAGIRTRHGVVNPVQEDISRWGTGARMRRFLAEAMPLGKEAVARALDDAGLSPDRVGLLTVVSSTGYATPGLDMLLARDLGMAADVQRLHLGHMGCYAALPALGAASDFVTARSRAAVVLCVELTSLHLQPPSDRALGGAPTPEDLQQMVAHALFGDAAAAVVLRPGGPGLEVVDLAAHTDVATAGEMTWAVTDSGWGCPPGCPRPSPATPARSSNSCSPATGSPSPMSMAGRCIRVGAASWSWSGRRSGWTTASSPRPTRCCVMRATARARRCCSSSTGSAPRSGSARAGGWSR
jgi:predicted naringenin-chalcone synthase